MLEDLKGVVESALDEMETSVTDLVQRAAQATADKIITEARKMTDDELADITSDHAEELRDVLRTVAVKKAAVVDEVREVAKEGHRLAKHGGRWDDCRDAVCAHLEQWLHWESKEAAA